MRKILLLAILALFILPLMVSAQSPCLETWVSRHPGETPLMQWSPAPAWTNQAPLEIGATTCQEGVSLFDQVWRGPDSASWIINVYVYRAALNSGSFYIYVTADSSAAGVLALDLSNAFGFSDRCKWSSGHSLNLKNVPEFQFDPEHPYYLRVVIASNSHAVCALRFCADETIGVEPTSWGIIKGIYR
ncbi:MAG: hypothetical protein ABIH38_03580 [Patescibacteria group bacterium]